MASGTRLSYVGRMIGRLRQIFARRAARTDTAPVQSFAPPRPEHPFVAVGDLHGRLDLLRALEARLAGLPVDWPVVFVGDYVDRGDESAAVLRQMMGDMARPHIAMMGNHEDMLLRFIDAPEAEAGRWLRNGGLQTLASFGVGGTPGQDPAAARDRLVEAMGPELVDWLRARPLWWQSGDVAVVHAGADPALPLPAQPRETLLWGHPAFGRVPRQDGLWVVHGHTIVDAPVAEGGRIPIDTGAFATGRLTAAVIEPGCVRFLQAGG